MGYLTWMIGLSIKEKKISFGIPDTVSSRKTLRKSSSFSLSRLYHAAASRSDLVGVNGPYFDLILLCREVIETALQTHQAYRMSRFLPRTGLNRCYTGLLVLNCWSTALVYSIFATSAPKRWVFAIICDCILDLVSSVGITTILLTIYSNDFDFTLNQFPANKWYEDIWVVHAMSEFQIILVSSWGDLAMRLVFALSMISNVNNMKKLLITHASMQNRAKMLNHRVTAVLPLHPSIRDISPGVDNIRNRFNQKVHAEARFTQILFVAWGLAILTFHIYADTIPKISQCKMQTKPWFTVRPSCSLLLLDCYDSQIDGRENEIIPEWSLFDPRTTVRIVIHHYCPALEVPAAITNFSSLKVLKIYNASIASWTERAAVTQAHHPDLIMAFFVRVNMTDGQLPMGLQNDDFPHSLNDIEFCVTNLRSLPDNLDLKWPQSASIYFEACNLTEIPEALARFAPYDLYIAMNPITSVPSSIIEGNVGYLHLGGTRISVLPESVSKVVPTFKLRIDNTEISGDGLIP